MRTLTRLDPRPLALLTSVVLLAYASGANAAQQIAGGPANDASALANPANLANASPAAGASPDASASPAASTTAATSTSPIGNSGTSGEEPGPMAESPPPGSGNGGGSGNATAEPGQAATPSGPEATSSSSDTSSGSAPPPTSAPDPSSPPAGAGTEEQASQPSSPEQPGSTANPSAGSQSPATPVANPTPGNSGPASSQGTAGSPSGSSSGAPDVQAAESNATTQAIWQVQISGCAADCREISQSQIATQANTTVQELASALEAAVDPLSEAGSGESSQGTSSVIQIQIGCLLECFGTTSTSDTPILAPYQQAIEAVLAMLAPVLPSLSLTPADDENTTVQTINQWQDGQGLEIVQTQSASEVNTTVQVAEILSALAALQAVLGVSGATTAQAPAQNPNGSSDLPSAEVVNQTAQGIWQVQIGCLYYCVQTTQYQQADQTNTTTQTALLGPGAASEPTAAVVNVTTQVIWQVQIGCLFWCVNTTQEQIAQNQGSPVLNGGQGASGPPPPTSWTPPDIGAQQTPSTADGPPSNPGAPPSTPKGPASTPQSPGSSPEMPGTPSASSGVSGSSAPNLPAGRGGRAVASSTSTAADMPGGTGQARPRVLRSAPTPITQNRSSIRLSGQVDAVSLTPGINGTRAIRVYRWASPAAPLTSGSAPVLSDLMLSTVTAVVVPPATSDGAHAGTSPSPVEVAPASASGPAPQQLGLAGAAGEGVLSDGTSVVLWAAIVISVLCFVPRRLGR